MHSFKYLLASYLLGLNAAFLGYAGAFHRLKLYLGIPLTILTFTQVRNYTLNNCLGRLYYPVEPLYEEVRNENKAFRRPKVETKFVPAKEREDLTDQDKAKIEAI